MPIAASIDNVREGTKITINPEDYDYQIICDSFLSSFSKKIDKNTILTVYKRNERVLWFSVENKKTGVGYYYGRFFLVGEPETKEEQLLRKINQLWVRQDYYKNYLTNS